MTKTYDDEVKIIDAMTREQMASLWRFAPAGHKYFRIGDPVSEYFSKRFKELGGFSPEISKSIGWENPRPGGGTNDE